MFVLKVVSLDKSLEKVFWDYVSREPLNYYFFVFDMKYRADRTKFWLAMDRDRVEGLLLVYRDFVAQLRGNRGAVRLLLDQVSLEKVDLQAPLDYEDIILGRYIPKVKEVMTLMSLRKGEETLRIDSVLERFGEEDAEELSEIMRNEDPVWWGEVTSRELKENMKDACWLGIRKDGKIASAGMSRLIDFGSNISVVFTRREYRNRGYATSVVSALVKEILKVSDVALIHVLSDNAPAIRTYTRVGFKPYRSYLSIHT
jgi:predicted GNAT family acetyltransferase